MIVFNGEIISDESQIRHLIQQASAEAYDHGYANGLAQMRKAFYMLIDQVMILKSGRIGSAKRFIAVNDFERVFARFGIRKEEA